MEGKNVLKSKKCFTCKRNYPNFIFPINKVIYQRPDDLGTCKVCKFCTYKQWSKNMYAWLYSQDIKKFQRIDFKTKLQIIKKLL
jgi:hypothetical protein